MTPFDSGILIQTVSDLRKCYEALDNPTLYMFGGENPYEFLFLNIPSNATYYTLIMERDVEMVENARTLLAGFNRRKRVKELTCTKDEVNYRKFAKVGKIRLMYI